MPGTVDLRADMVGSVALFHLEDGATVATGEQIMDIECMKVFYPVVATVAGVVRLRVVLGAVVGQGDVVASIETP